MTYWAGVKVNKLPPMEKVTGGSDKRFPEQSTCGYKTYLVHN